MKFHNTDVHITSATLIAVVVAALLIILFIVDVSCFFVNDTGLIWLVCGKKSTRTPRDDVTKIGSLYSWQFPLPYCSNKDSSSNEGGSLRNNATSDAVIVPLPDMNFVFEGKELLNNGHRDGKIRIESKPMIDGGYKRETAVEYDMKKSISRTSFVGKDSAV